MSIELSPDPGARRQIEQILAAGTTDVVRIGPAPVVLLTVRGARSGRLRYQLVIRVERDGQYALVASNDGLDRNPAWYFNLLAHPEVHLRDGRRDAVFRAREVSGQEKASWWELAVRTFPRYAGYQAGTEREIPVLVLARS